MHLSPPALLRLAVPGILLAAGLASPCRAATNAPDPDKPGLPFARIGERGVHPRLFINASGVEALRTKIGGTHKALWDAFLKHADEEAKDKPDTYRTDVGEQLWQRQVGNTMSDLAFAFLVSRDKKIPRRGGSLGHGQLQLPDLGPAPGGRRQP